MISASLANSAGCTGGSGPSWSQRAESPTSMGWNGPIDGRSTTISSRNASRKHAPGDEAQEAIVEPAHEEHHRDADAAPDDLWCGSPEQVTLAVERDANAGAGEDHQDPDRHQRHDRDQDQVVGLVALALRAAQHAPVAQRLVGPGRRGTNRLDGLRPDRRRRDLLGVAQPGSRRVRRCGADGRFRRGEAAILGSRQQRGSGGAPVPGVRLRRLPSDHRRTVRCSIREVTASRNARPRAA